MLTTKEEVITYSFTHDELVDALFRWEAQARLEAWCNDPCMSAEELALENATMLVHFLNQ